MPSMSEPSAMTGLPEPQRRHPRGRNAGDAALDLEAVLLEDAGQVLGRLELLEAELAEAEDLSTICCVNSSMLSTSAATSFL